MSEDHHALLTNLACSIGSEALGRMLGLWLEQESLVRSADNRELALEVASLRLARWPSVRLVEEWLAGSGAVGADLGGGPGRSGPPSANTSSESSRGPEPTGGTEASGGEDAQPDGGRAAPEDTSLTDEAGTDPGVVLATRILGGDVVAVRPDGEGS
jgi:hypothetical protein